MHIRDVYQPFAHIDANRLAFGVLVHHQDNTFEQVEMFSMKEDNRKLFSEAMRFEGMRLHESDVDNALYGGVITSVLTVTKHPRDIKLFSSNLYFEIAEHESYNTPSVVLTDQELEQKAYVDSDAIHAEYVRPMRSLLAVVFAENDGVYTIFDHCLSDFLNEADMEIREYIARWNKSKLQKPLFVA